MSMELFHAYKVDFFSREGESDVSKDDKSIARVVMFDSFGNKIDSKDYAVVRKDEIYAWLDEGKDVDLNDCYIKDFSLSEYRKQNNLGESDYVELGNWTAINSFFDADHHIDFSYSFIKNDALLFLNSIFTCNELSFLHCKIECREIDFSQSHFHCKSINFQYSSFQAKEASFKDSVFSCDTVSFINCDFNNSAISFSGVDFRKASVAFQFAKFGDSEISFEKARFWGERVDFSKVEFGKGRVDFRLAEFGDGSISFDECEQSQGKFRFRRAKFGSGHISFELAQLPHSEISFERCEFGNGKLSFYQCTCSSIDLNSSELNNYVDLRVKDVNMINLSGTIVRDFVDLSNEKGKVRIEQLNLSNMRNLGRLFLDYYDNDVKRLILSQKDTSIKMKADQFRLLKEEFRALGQYTDEDQAYLQFKRLELKDRKIRTLKTNKFNGIWFYPVYWGEKLIFDQIGHYATNPMRVLVSMIISFLVLTFSHVLLILTTNSDIVSSVGDPDKLPLITKSVYHSAITFLTIGYGDYYPSGLIRWLSGIEGFIGLFLMSYFTVAFVRKVLR